MAHGHLEHLHCIRLVTQQTTYATVDEILIVCKAQGKALQGYLFKKEHFLIFLLFGVSCILQENFRLIFFEDLALICLRMFFEASISSNLL